MRRLVLPLAVLTGLLIAPATGQAYTLGVSDQQAAMFTNPLFAPLKFKAARYITPYDVVDSPQDLALADAWINNARAANQRILVAFERSHVPGRERHLPTVAEYTAAIQKFKARYPFVKEISVWNEVNRCQSRSRIQGQPTCGKERRLAQYYSAVRRVFGPSTKVVALDVLDEQNVGRTVGVIRRFLRYAKPRPKVLGFHNYSDTNRFSTTRTRRVLATWRGDVWLTETGGIVKLGRSFPYSLNRAAKALGCMFTLAKANRRIKRLYVYQFHPAPDPRTAEFDAGLINPDNTPRPGYAVVQKRKARSCRP